jgi:CRP-like cAMP-binding protein
MDSNKTLSSLKKLHIISNCTDKNLSELAKLAKHVKAPRGSDIISEDSETSDVFGVIAGRVDVQITVPGSSKKEIIATIREGEFFGEMILLGRGRRTASAVAKDDVELFVWDKQDLLKLFEGNTSIGYFMMFEIARVLADRLYSTNLHLRNTLSRMPD